MRFVLLLRSLWFVLFLYRLNVAVKAFLFYLSINKCIIIITNTKTSLYVYQVPQAPHTSCESKDSQKNTDAYESYEQFRYSQTLITN